MFSHYSIEQILLNLSSPSEAAKKRAEMQIEEMMKENLPALLQQMLNILWQDPDSDQGTAPLYSNVRIGLRLLGDPARDALLAEMRARNHTRLASNALHHWRTDPLARAGWTELASDPHAEMHARMNCIYGMGTYPHRESIDVLLALADDPTPAISISAIRQFYGWKDADLQAELYARWQGRDNLSPNQRAALACGLLGNHPQGHGGIFEQALADPDPWVRREISQRLRTLEWFHQWARPAHFRILTEDPSPFVRQTALEHLCLRAKPEELNHFLAALRLDMETDSLAQMYFVMAFKKIGVPAIAALKSQLVPPNALWNKVSNELLGKR